MSWQVYVDQHICPHVSSKVAVIAGLQDGAIWAKYEKDEASSVTSEELKAIADTMKNNPKVFFESGIRLGGEKYFCLSAENNLVRGRKKSSALCIVATNTCLLAVSTLDGFPAGQLNTVVERLGDYIRSSNY